MTIPEFAELAQDIEYAVTEGFDGFPYGYTVGETLEGGFVLTAQID